MSNIAYIGPGGKGEVTPPGVPFEDAIEILEELLAEAREGKLSALAIAAVLDEGVRVTKREHAYKGGYFADLYVATDQLKGCLRKYIDEAGS